MIERGVIICSGEGPIQLGDLFPAMSQASDSMNSAPFSTAEGLRSADAAERILDGLESLDDLEGDLLKAAVSRSEGNLSAAARLLGINRPQLAYWLKKYDKGKK